MTRLESLAVAEVLAVTRELLRVARELKDADPHVVIETFPRVKYGCSLCLNEMPVTFDGRLYFAHAEGCPWRTVHELRLGGDPL